MKNISEKINTKPQKNDNSDNVPNSILSSGERCLVISPHPDDETIGMGGFLLQNPLASDVLVLTDGQNNRPGDSEIVTIRHQEFVRVMRKIGIKNYQQWNIKDSHVKKNLFRLLRLRFNDYDYVFVPSRYETHRDHRCLYPFLKFWLRFYRPKLVSYEIGVPQLHPNVTIDISNVAAAKEKMIEEYSSQLGTKYTKMLGLNQYRGLRLGYDYAESFYVEDCRLFPKLISRYEQRRGVVWVVLGIKFKFARKSK